MDPAEPITAGTRAGVFTTTHWSVFRELRQTDPARSTAALTALCRTYWLPVYVWLRRQRGATHHEAEDLTQAFFQHLIEHKTLFRAVREQGRFRSFLQAALQYFLANEWDRQQTLKRGGQFEFMSLEQAIAEGWTDEVPVDSPLPETLFDRQWAAALIRQTLDRLRHDYAEAGKAALFRLLEPALTLSDADGCCAACAAKLGMSEGAARVALHRLRGRFAELLRNEVAQTVARPEEVDEELRHLLAVIGR